MKSAAAKRRQVSVEGNLRGILAVTEKPDPAPGKVLAAVREMAHDGLRALAEPDPLARRLHNAAIVIEGSTEVKVHKRSYGEVEVTRIIDPVPYHWGIAEIHRVARLMREGKS